LLVQHAHLLVRRRQMRRDFLATTESVAARVSFNLGAVQRNPFQSDQTFGAQHAQHLREKIVESGLVVRAETRQRAMTDRLQPAQPLAARFVFALPRQFACRTDPAAVGVQPQTDQQLRVRVLPPRATFHRCDLGVI